MRKTHFIPDLPSIWKFFINPKTDWKPKILIGLALVYLVWPLDLMPDLAPLIGWLDDIGFVGLATWYLVSATDKFLKR